MVNMKNEARPPMRLTSTWHWTVARNPKRCNFKQCCHEGCCCAMHVLTVHNCSQCHLPCWKRSQLPTPWTRSLNAYERFSLLFPHPLHAFFAKHPKTINLKADTVQFLAEKKITPQTLKCDWQKRTKLLRAWTLKRRFLKRACWSLVPVIRN